MSTDNIGRTALRGHSIVGNHAESVHVGHATAWLSLLLAKATARARPAPGSRRHHRRQ